MDIETQLLDLVGSSSSMILRDFFYGKMNVESNFRGLKGRKQLVNEGHC
jgi:hypothetical protein